MGFKRFKLLASLSVWGALTLSLHAQIDPVRRHLIEAGYQQAIEGHVPLQGYAYYYLNHPGFLRTNLTLRAAIAPVYLDSELGVSGVLTPRTDLGIGLNGGGFAYGYNEIRQGKFYEDQSFLGHGGGASLSLYHRFNPGATIPLSGMLRGDVNYALYERDDQTAPNFTLPEDQAVPAVRAGLRWGGQAPVLSPDLAFEVSGYYEAQFRLQSGPYGYNGDRRLESVTHLFWGRAGFIYTFPKLKHRMDLNITGGGTIHADRFSAYRLGGMFTLASEFPYALPGYYFGELSARNFVLMGGGYTIPLDVGNHWQLTAGGITGTMAYTPGLEQPQAWNSGVGGGLTYSSASKAWKCILAYGYGINAMRSHGPGANSVAFVVQFDLEKAAAAQPQWNEFDRGTFFQRLLKSF